MSVVRRKPSDVFDLDSEVRSWANRGGISPKLKTQSDHIAGFLPRKDASNILLLVFLYLLQGVPIGLTFGALPFLLKSRMSYSDVAIFSFASYPYSLKLLWSPIVDTKFIQSLGRRKSWIVPIQLLAGALFWYLGRDIDDLLNQPQPDIYWLTAIFFVTILLCATQDIAVDGWALTLLSKENMQFASTSQNIGINTGYFLSFTVFLALNSAEFCNRYLRDKPQLLGVLQLGPYMRFWGAMFVILTICLLFFKHEVTRHETEDDVGIKGAYKTIWSICKLRHMKAFILVLLLSKIGFICNESVTALKLLEKGFGKEDLALAVLVDFPFQLLFGYYAAKWSSGARPLKPWLYAFYGRLFFSIVGMLVVHAFPNNGISNSYFVLVIGTTVLSSFTSTVQFVSLGAFFSFIADPLIGGTYMTLLNTLSNFGGTWPRFFILEAVDLFTKATCSLPNADGATFSCVSDTGKTQCRLLSGRCVTDHDGYYYVGTVSVIVGTLLLLLLVRPRIKMLEALPASAWKVRDEEGITTMAERSGYASGADSKHEIAR